MKKLFFVISIIGFFTPFVLFFLLKYPNDNLKILALYFLPKLNLTYFAIIIVFFFLGLKFKWAQFAQILFIIFYISFLCVNYFILAPIHVKEFAKKHKNAIIVKITKLKNYPNFQLLYKEGAYAVIIPSKAKKHTNPFNYVRDRGQY